jgi:hypothetical protein
MQCLGFAGSQLKHRASAGTRSAAAFVELFQRLGFPDIDLQTIVDRELRSGLNGPQCGNEEAIIFLLHFGVGLAAMVDPPCRIPALRAVHDLPVIQAEEKRMTMIDRFRTLPRDTPALVLDDSIALTDLGKREETTAVDWGETNGNATHSEVFGNDGGNLSARWRSASRENRQTADRERAHLPDEITRVKPGLLSARELT